MSQRTWQPPGWPARTARSDARQPLTARGAAFVMFSVFLFGTLAAGSLHLGPLAGLSFVAGAAVAACFVRRQDLLAVVASPPMIFLGAVICIQAANAKGSVVISTLEGTLLTLSNAAPWLFGGVALSVAIGWSRGLPECISRLRGSPAPAPGGPERSDGEAAPVQPQPGRKAAGY